MNSSENDIYRDLTFTKIKGIHDELREVLKESHEKYPKDITGRLSLVHAYNNKVLLLINHA